jgi:hypothetical protein
MMTDLCRMIWLLAPPPPPPVSKLDRRRTGRLRNKDELLTGEGEGVGAGNQILRPQESLALYKSVNTL